MWSIGIYIGDSPFHLHAPQGHINPVLTRADVNDIPAQFVADPFMVRRDGVWYMFFEVMNSRTNRGEIGLATSQNALNWDYQQIVLVEPFHLSYPYVFEWNNEFYMIPETVQPASVRLYKADDFPNRWSLVGSLVEQTCADPSIFRFEERWWLFACSTPYQHDTLRLYFSPELLGPWKEHPVSPIVRGNKRTARPAGRVLIMGDKVIRLAQDCVPKYGTQVRAFEISKLNASNYCEVENQQSPVLKASGSGWNMLGMHHIDAHQTANGQWIACVDGFSESRDQSVVPD